MDHSFVAAELVPCLPGCVKYGQSVLDDLIIDTEPFLALYIQPTDSDQSDSGSYFGREPNLFVVSRQRPTSPNNEYFVLNQADCESDARTLSVFPPLPFNGPLYLFVTPRICASFEDTASHRRLANKKTYQLDEASLDRFFEFSEVAAPSILATRETGGNDEPTSSWDTYSGDSLRETSSWFPKRPRQVQFYFELVPFHSLPTDLELHIFEELSLLRQLTSDYIWKDCEPTTQYVKSIRNAHPHLVASGRIRSPILATLQPNPSLQVDLQSLRALHDKDPYANVGEDDDWDPDDWNAPLVCYVPRAELVPAVEAKDIHAIVLDSNVLIDRDRPLQDALIRIFPFSQHQFTPKELLDLYVEYGTLRAADGQPDSPMANVQDVARYLSVSVNQSDIRTVLEHYANPRLYPKISTIISSLIKRGYSLLVLPFSSPGGLALLQTELPDLLLLSPPTSSQVPGSWEWESLLQNHYSTLRPDQVLVVTSDIYRNVKSASMAGFPTAFIRHARSRSDELSILTTIPTFTFTGTLAGWLQMFKNVASVIKSQGSAQAGSMKSSRMQISFKQYRDCYQVTSILGSGSFAIVYNAKQVHTGADVAIKFDYKPGRLLYEAAIYDHLKDVPGIPRIHWRGMDHTSFVIVMDKLGPNLEQLKKVCRRRFGLRTVLMLGEQMLSTIAEIHARGIIVRDIKPENFAMGLAGEHKRLHLFDFGLSKWWLDPMTGKHVPFSEGNYAGIGTARYASCNVHFGLESSRRDDVEAIGFLLLYFLHGRLPWQGIYAADELARLCRLGEMKSGKPFADLLAHKDTPQSFVEFFKHCRSLEFEDQPDYQMLRGLFRKEFKSRGWGEYDWEYDWWKGNGERGTLMLGEYKYDAQMVEPVRHQQDVL